MIAADDNDILIRANRAADNTTNRHASHIVVRLKGCHHHLQRTFCVALGCRNLLHNRLHQRFQIIALILHFELCDTIACRCIDHRKVKLIVVRIQFHEQFKDLIVDIIHTLIGAVNLIDDHNRLELLFKRLTQHILRLRHRPFKCIDKQQNAVHHIENALHLAAKVRMSRRIHNIDLDIVVENRSILRKNCNSPLALDIPRVHHALIDLLIRAKNVTLTQHCIDQGRLTVIDMCNNGNVAQLFIRRHI